MKTIHALLLLLALSFIVPQSLQAQTEQLDVIYLKNGSIYKGKITEYNPGQNYVIRTTDGVMVRIYISNIDHITTGDTPATEQIRRPEETSPTPSARSYDPSERRPSRRSFVYRDKGYFFQGHLMVGGFEAGLHFVNGYKFNRWAYLGLGVGFDAVLFAIPGNVDYMGFHFPVFLYYSGDILKRRITPFYAAEIGYAFHSGKNGLPVFGNSNNAHDLGGIMGGFGLGVRFFTRGKAYINLSFNLDVKNPTNRYDQTRYSGSGNPITVSYTTSAVLYFPAFKFGIGF